MDRFVGREDALRALNLGLASRHHVFLLGPAGTAKTSLVRAWAQAQGMSFFSHLLTAFTVPEEVFGPLDLAALKEGRLVRRVEGFLPTAEVAFLDEVFKASSEILNTLLQVMQERVFAVEPPQARPVPLRVLVGASNELPGDSSLAALYDRFLLRVHVQYLPDAEFRAMLRGEGQAPARVELPGVVEDVRVGDDVIDAVVAIRQALRKEGIVPSDRRFKQGLDVVRAQALLRGSDLAEAFDCEVLTMVLWDKPEQRPVVDEVVLRAVCPEMEELRAIAAEMEAAYAQLDLNDASKIFEYASRLTTAIKRMGALVERIPAAHRDGARSKVEALRALHREITVERLGLGV
jgi:MoxR-like ATPase